MIWIVVALVVVAGLWFWWEGSWDRRLFAREPGRECVNVNAHEANEWLRSHPETQVLDVRSAGEFAGGAIPGAVNVSVGDDAFDAKVGALDRQKPVLVYCAGGYRSRKAVERLKALGFANIRHIHRGWMSWKPDA